MKLNDLINGNIYLEKNGTFAERIDFAWKIYSGSRETKNRTPYINNLQKEYRIGALKFLIYAFDIKDITNPSKVNNQLKFYMECRNGMQEKNPEYVPGKPPQNIVIEKLSDNKKIARPKFKYKVTNAIRNQELLPMVTKKQVDIDLNVKYLNIQERAKYRVHIRKGIFKKDGKNFDSSTNISHDKKGFVAYTLNTNGELSVFDHYGRMRDVDGNLILHSSMNSGVPVVSAGELRIINGVLEAVTAYSGHYKPSLFNVFRFLEHISSHDVDLSNVRVLVNNSPSLDIEVTKEKINNLIWFKLPATDLCGSIQGVLNTCLKSIDRDLKTYKNNAFFNFFYKGRDFLSGNTLTEDRAKLANELQSKMNAIKGSITTCISARDLNTKIDDMNNLLIDINSKNDKLSADNGKEKGSGRLSENITKFKEQVNQLNKITQKETKTIDVDIMKGKKP